MGSARATIRISKELQDLKASSDLSLAVHCDDSNVRNVRAMIIGPPGTPYEYGFFEFAVHFGPDYPGSAPKVAAKTTNGGRTRFNPNIYAAGKVCLSILGTWRGEAGENWSSAQCLESVLVSIQSLMSSNPYENEPGFENATSERDLKSAEAYADKIKHETIRITVIERLEEYLGISTEGRIEGPPAPWDGEVGSDEDNSLGGLLMDAANTKPFFDLCKRRFLWYFTTYLNTIDFEHNKHKDGEVFQSMPFESTNNGMNGKFNYGDLRRRLLSIQEHLANEHAQWASEGQQALKDCKGNAANLNRQFTQIVAFNKDKIFNLEMELVDSNPFVWRLTLYGKPMSKLEGGIFNIILHISPKFPAEQPRAILTMPIFHYRVAEDGFLCYFVKKPEDMRSHVDAIVEALENDSIPYDPRTTVRPEASKLFWGNADDKKQYSRRLRRSVEATTEG